MTDRSPNKQVLALSTLIEVAEIIHGKQAGGKLMHSANIFGKYVEHAAEDLKK